MVQWWSGHVSKYSLTHVGAEGTRARALRGGGRENMSEPAASKPQLFHNVINLHYFTLCNHIRGGRANIMTYAQASAGYLED